MQRNGPYAGKLFSTLCRDALQKGSLMRFSRCGCRRRDVVVASATQFRVFGEVVSWRRP